MSGPLKLIFLSVIIFLTAAPAAAQNIDLYLDGEKVDHKAYLNQDNRVYVAQSFITKLGGTIDNNELFQPIREIGQKFGVNISWVDGSVWVTTPGGLPPPKRIYYKDRAVVLMYHHFDNNEQGCTISADRFKQHVQMLEQEGFNVVSLGQIGRFLDGHAELPVNAVAITFDDGYASNYHVAYPVLKEKGWPASIFMIVKNIGVDDWFDRLNWTQLKELSQNDVAIYSHTYDSHKYVTDYRGRNVPILLATMKGETPDRASKRILSDLQKSRQELINQLGGSSEHLSLPYGRGGNRVRELANQAGYRYIWTIEPRAVTRNSSPNSLGRLDVGNPQMDASELKNAILKAAKN